MGVKNYKMEGTTKTKYFSLMKAVKENKLSLRSLVRNLVFDLYKKATYKHT